MSMITQMLKDLDARQATGGEESVITAGVVLRDPPAQRSGRSRLLVFLIGGCLILAGLSLWYTGGPAEPLPTTSEKPMVRPPAVATANDVSLMPAMSTAAGSLSKKSDTEPAMSETLPVAILAAVAAASVPEAVMTPPHDTAPEALPLITAGAGDTITKLKAGSSPRDSAAAQAAKARKDSDGALRKAVALARQSHIDEALVAARQAINDNPTNHRARQLLIDLMIAAGRGDEARVSLRDGLEFAPGNAGFYMRLACLQMSAGASGDALATMQQGQFAAEDNADYRALFEAVRDGQTKPATCGKLSPHR